MFFDDTLRIQIVLFPWSWGVEAHFWAVHADPGLVFWVVGRVVGILAIAYAVKLGGRPGVVVVEIEVGEVGDCLGGPAEVAGGQQLGERLLVQLPGAPPVAAGEGDRGAGGRWRW